MIIDKKHNEEYKRLRKEIEKSPIPESVYGGDDDKGLNEKARKSVLEAFDRLTPKDKEEQDSFIR